MIPKKSESILSKFLTKLMNIPAWAVGLSGLLIVALVIYGITTIPNNRNNSSDEEQKL